MKTREETERQRQSFPPNRKDVKYYRRDEE